VPLLTPMLSAMPAAADLIRVAIINDYEVVVRGLADMLGGYSDRIDVIELSTREGVSSSVDLVLYDTYSRPREDPRGVQELTEDQRVAAVAVYTWNFEPELIDGALAAGARGYLAKTLPAKELVESVERIHGGEVVVSPDPGHTPVVSGEWPGRAEGLSLRESEMIALITQGRSNQEICRLAYLSPNTVKSYIRSAYRKIGITSRSQAVLWGVEHGMRAYPYRVSRTEQLTEQSG
jgi:DNA-binding NarL/FixJ family response regulator